MQLRQQQPTHAASPPSIPVAHMPCQRLSPLRPPPLPCLILTVTNWIPGKPLTPVAPPPGPNYNWDVPFTPCYWDKKASKDSSSLSCAASGQTVATGKYGVIEVRCRR